MFQVSEKVEMIRHNSDDIIARRMKYTHLYLWSKIIIWNLWRNSVSWMLFTSFHRVSSLEDQSPPCYIYDWIFV